jgi:pimeloyl-ACP methyl ester carboxylesterase
MSCDAYLSVGSVRIRYRDEGTGPPIVLLHGWTLDLEIWEPQVEDLQQSFRLIRCDRRGFGLSSGTPDLQADATDVLSLCEHLDLGSFDCVGMSQSTRVVLSMARMRPRQLRRVVLDGPPGLLGSRNPATPDLDYVALRKLARRSGMEAFRREWRQHPLTALATQDPARHELLQRILRRYPGHDLLSDADRAPQADGPVLEVIQQPAMILNGMLDIPARLLAGAALAAALPRCEHVIIPGARHLANLDNPAAYNSQLRRFFSSMS